MPRTRFTLAMALVLGVGLPLAAAPANAQNGLAGAYLAARAASGANDYRAAAEYFTKALVRDPGNTGLMEGAVIAQIALGRLDTSVPIARRLRQAGGLSQVGELVLLVDQIVREDYEELFTDYDAGRQTGPLVDGLVQAWALLGQGRATEALAAFDAIAQTGALAPFAAYHKALALALVGDFEGADRLFAGEEGETAFRLNRRGVIAHAQVLGQLDRFDEALGLLDMAFGADPDPAIQQLRAAIERRDPPPFDLIGSPRDGLGEVFLTLAGALNNEAQDAYVLMYSRLAEIVAPGNTDAILMSAALLERQNQYDLATETYNKIARDDPAFHLAEMGRAEALYSAGRIEAAVEVLQQLSKSHAELPDVHRALGDMLRREERYAEAAQAYEVAIGQLPVDDPSHWVLYYVRGISYERTDRWEQAESDFRKALEMSPDQPQVLNYLGYSFLEKKTNLDEALEMIERAVAARPDDGYIIDSLAWGLYRLGRYDEALPHMERASQLMPTDPIVTDHLGDVYWAVGRKREAEFQWHRALSYYIPGESQDFDPERVRRKLEIGLDAVLREEGGEPIKVADDNG